MTRGAVHGAGVAVLVCAAVAAAQQPVFRAGTDIVSVAATVTDRRGEFLTELGKDDFELLEDGKAQTVQYFARGDDLGQGPELHVGLLFDTSGSMESDIALSRSAAIRFLNAMSHARDMTLVDFDTEVRVTRFNQDDFPRLVERIRSRKPRGFTAMYDALGVYLDGAAHGPGRKILIIFTDGGDTGSAIRFGDAMTLVRAADVTVYSIGFLQNQSRGARGDQRLRLTQIAQESGGHAFFPSSMKQVDEAYDRIAAQIRAQYTLGYVSSNTIADGAWRKVEVRVRGTQASGARVLSRKGYFAPYRQ
jgi:Ca-activated chloride channel family protein